MASKGGGGSGKTILISLALLSAFLFFQTFGMLPTAVNDDIVRWASCATFAVAAVVFGKDGSAVWCGLCAALAVVRTRSTPSASATSGVAPRSSAAWWRARRWW
jgi:hypothetical protein